MSVKSLPLTMALIAGLGLAGCSSGRSDVTSLTVAKALVAPKAAPAVQDPQQVAASVAEALNVLDGPLALATFEKTKNNVVLRQIETNGSYRTWTSWGSGERRSITTLNGTITATRGLRNDLMSSDVGQSLSLISARQSGTANRVQRYLDGENLIVAVQATCTITRGETTRVQVGEIDRMAVQMIERCQTGGGVNFSNIYSVDSSGRVLQSVQWLNDFYGVTVVQQLR
ncbi:YjbF family lipoprotein [Roseovarius sp. 2305UL8-3]|uniref:YjbF family lipoprotein n=1 Tax=Roseovarius conchicola TaxID=3121636 RepID=UPI0035297644